MLRYSLLVTHYSFQRLMLRTKVSRTAVDFQAPDYTAVFPAALLTGLLISFLDILISPLFARR
ncbi:MAG: hypothetical protein UY24_C0027G0001, partial [Parcubacteria group bacterium GW2011_GWA1_48_11b]